jgi:hypothetical protein
MNRGDAHANFNNTNRLWLVLAWWPHPALPARQDTFESVSALLASRWI